MALFQSRNQLFKMGGLSTTQALMNQIQALQGQVTQLKAQPSYYSNQNVPSRNEVPMEVAVQPMPNMFSAAGLLAMKGMLDQGTPCIWVTGLSEEFADPDILCNVFGNYGNVQVVKFSKKVPNGALIEMDDARQAKKCCKYLDGKKVGGQELSVKPSKIEKVYLSKGDQDDKSKDFSRERVHRFINKDSRFTRIVMSRASWPTSDIMVSGIPEGKVDEVKAYIIESGYTVKDVKEIQGKLNTDGKPASGKTTVIIQLASTEEAISAVGKLHNTMPTKIGEKNGPRGLSFSFTNQKDFENRKKTRLAEKNKK